MVVVTTVTYSKFRYFQSFEVFRVPEIFLRRSPAARSDPVSVCVKLTTSFKTLQGAIFLLSYHG